ncbi:MAG: helix-turn-helix transcriptional regulator, partial [Ramlibacter sp.]
LYVDERTLASIVLNRRALDFSERDKERLELLRPHLSFLYRQACRARRATAAIAASSPPAQPAQPEPIPALLTQREGEVMQWLSYGKTDADIAALLAISPRTVHKHLEHIYVKLGVETRTAAVMRARSLASATPVRESSATSGYRPGRGISSPGTRPSHGSSLRGPAPTA